MSHSENSVTPCLRGEQPELGFFEAKADDPNIPFLISILYERDWTTARQVIALVWERAQVRWIDRKVRALAAASKGEIAGGQRGYKLVKQMTNDEYQHWRNWMTSQADEMRKRVVEADRIFYSRKPIGT